MSAALCHNYVIRSRGITGDHSLSIDNILYVLNRNQTRIWLSFHNIVTNIIMPESTICVECGPYRHTT